MHVFHLIIVGKKKNDVSDTINFFNSASGMIYVYSCVVLLALIVNLSTSIKFDGAIRLFCNTTYKSIFPWEAPIINSITEDTSNVRRL